VGAIFLKKLPGDAVLFQKIIEIIAKTNI